MKFLKKFKQQLDNKKKQQEQEELIRVLQQPEKQRHRPAAKFASNRIKNTGPR